MALIQGDAPAGRSDAQAAPDLGLGECHYSTVATTNRVGSAAGVSARKTLTLTDETIDGRTRICVSRSGQMDYLHSLRPKRLLFPSPE
jgi:hypothetical protein